MCFINPTKKILFNWTWSENGKLYYFKNGYLNFFVYFYLHVNYWMLMLQLFFYQFVLHVENCLTCYCCCCCCMGCQFGGPIMTSFYFLIRRIKYIDDDLQPRRFQFKNLRHKIGDHLQTTPFTLNELHSLNQENQAFRARVKREFNLNTATVSHPRSNIIKLINIFYLFVYSSVWVEILTDGKRNFFLSNKLVTYQSIIHVLITIFNSIGICILTIGSKIIKKIVNKVRKKSFFSRLTGIRWLI